MQLAALTGSLLYVIFLSWHFSRARILWYDELLAWNLLTDTSFHHMWASWNQGADSGGLLFYVLGRPLVLGFRHYVFPIRLASALALWGTAVLWWGMLRRNIPGAFAAFAVAFVFLGNSTLLNYVAEIRFYALLLFTATLAVYAGSWMERAQPSRRVAFALSFVTNGLLISSHMLGLIYSAAVLFAVLVSAFPRRLKPAAIAGGLASWSLLATYGRAIHAGATKLNWIPMPRPIELIRYLLHRPTDFRPFNLLLLLLLATAAGKLWYRSKPVPRPSLVPAFSLSMLFVPFAFYVISHAYKPLFAERYMMPYLLGLAYLTGRALWLVTEPYWPPRPSQRALVTVAALAAVALVHQASLRDQALRPYAAIASLMALHPSGPLVIPDDRLFLTARYEQGPVTTHVAYLTPPLSQPEQDASIMTTLVKRGYAAHVYTTPAFLVAHPSFLYLDVPPAADPNTWQLADDPTLRRQQVGSIHLAGRTVPILLVRRP